MGQVRVESCIRIALTQHEHDLLTQIAIFTWKEMGMRRMRGKE